MEWQDLPLDPAADVDDTTGGFTELRCHGVSGPRPGEVLGFPEPLVTLVDGNADSGFWRRWMLGPARDVPGEQRREAFCWGGLTSRAAVQALWLLLLPFTVVNLAHWTLLPYGERGWLADPGRLAARSAVVLLRVLALSLTGTLLLSAAEITMDLGAWQCGATANCRPKLLPFGLMNSEGGQPGLRLGAAALAMSLGLLLLWLVGRSRDKPLQTDAPAPGEPAGASSIAVPIRRTQSEPVLGHPGFWATARSAAWLRGLHAVFWCGGTAAILAGVLATASPAGRAAGRLGVALATVSLAVTAVAALLTMLPVRFSCRGSAVALTNGLRVLLSCGLVLLAGTIAAVVALLPGRADGGGARLPWLQGAAGWLLAVQLVVLVLLAGCVAWLALDSRRHRRAMPPGYRPMLGGWLAFVLAFLAWFLALCYSAGLGLVAAGRWGNAVTVPVAGGTVAGGTGLEVLVPPVYQWVEVAGVATAASLVAGLLGAGVLSLARARRAADAVAVARLPPVPLGDLARAERARARWAGRIVAVAQSVELIPYLLAVAVAVVLGVAVAAVCWHGLTAGPLFPAAGWLERTSSVGTWLATTCTSGLLALTYSAFRSQRTRRLVGIIWDVTTFWPRANHPLTPACTAERSVPQLAGRIARLTAGEADRLVLSAHNQGAALGLTAVLQLAAAGAHLDRVWLLTFGNPLRRVYARAFPAYFAPGVLGQAAAALGGRWTNLWAASDPIGGDIGPLPGGAPAGGAVTDQQIAPDPLTLGVDPRTGEPPAVCGNTGYVRLPAYEEALRVLRSALLESR